MTRRVKLGLPEARDHGGLHLCFIDAAARHKIFTAYVDVVHLLCERKSGFASNHNKQLIACT